MVSYGICVSLNSLMSSGSEAVLNAWVNMVIDDENV